MNRSLVDLPKTTVYIQTCNNFFLMKIDPNIVEMCQVITKISFPWHRSAFARNWLERNDKILVSVRSL